MDRVRGSRPDDETWRADALEGSRHSRWAEELRRPLENRDLDSARAVCAQICRLALQDYAPALLLLPDNERQRAQALTAYSLVLFDFVRQTGLEGERLAAINRWEFELESALDGHPAGQPVFVLLHHLEQKQPWVREGFDQLHTYARRRCALPRPTNPQTAGRNAGRLAETLLWLALGEIPDTSIVQIAESLVRMHGLLALGDDLRRHRPQIPLTDLPDSFDPADPSQTGILATAIESECLQVRLRLGEYPEWRQLPERMRPAARYCWLASRKLLARTEQLGPRLVETPPHLGLLDRLTMLLRSRLSTSRPTPSS